MRALVIGYGSIGARHARILAELGCNTAVLSSRSINFPLFFSSLDRAIDVHQPDYVVVASQTSSHYSDITRLIDVGFTGSVLVEKPLFKTHQELPKNNFKTFNVAYNLRFHPVIQKVRSILEGQKIISVNAYVGQYLPDWRPGTDYSKGYSAFSSMGGGVLRDLSHELDFISWLAGDWSRLTASGGHFSDLNIDSDDAYGLLWSAEKCPLICVQLSYLDRNPTRKFIVNTDKITIESDLNLGTIKTGDLNLSLPSDRDYTYRKMHEAVINGQYHLLCTSVEAYEIMALIKAAEISNQQKIWVSR
ncbi:Gfo/Idh/MocA family oxidoreductase [Polynucleobacter paneuropaeus]|nr:Gfo/Idh/MocA family oxidoreductase [Polynucleobacter paneuropaeus]